MSSREAIQRPLRMSRSAKRALAAPALIIIATACAACAGAVRAQEIPPAPGSPSLQTRPGAPPPCVQPAPMPTWQDYQGPFQKAVGAFGRRLERTTTQPPHYIPGAKLCVLTLHDKVSLAVHDTFDPITFLDVAYDAGIGQAEDNDPSYGQGAIGYAKRFGASFAGQASSEFFKVILYPTIFSQDPRYYRMARGSTKDRFLHALEHSVVAYNVNGTRMFNFTEWLGTTTAVVLSNSYHPDNARGVQPAARRVSYGVAFDTCFDVLREFWPQVARKLKLPFRGQNEPPPPAPAPEKN
jgi:hypothetical protein